MIVGTLFNSFSTFMFWVMEPSEYDTLLTALDASFNLIDTTVLPIASVLLVLGIVAALAMAPTLDVLTLGRDRATALGVAYRRTVTRLLIIVAGLVAAAIRISITALALGQALLQHVLNYAGTTCLSTCTNWATNWSPHTFGEAIVAAAGTQPSAVAGLTSTAGLVLRRQSRSARLNRLGRWRAVAQAPTGQRLVGDGRRRS